jgi:S1-C subfamily serine protease
MRTKQPRPLSRLVRRAPGHARAGALMASAIVALVGTASVGRASAAVRSAPTRDTSTRSSLEAGVVDVDAVLGYRGAESFGTGIVVAASGEVITNNHVIDGATKVSAVVVATGASYPARVVGTDPTRDIAVLQLLGAQALSSVRLGDSNAVAIGGAVVAVGNAGGRGGPATITTGAVTALDQTVTAAGEATTTTETLRHLIEVDAPLQPGESGGPLYNARGEVVGIDSIGAATGRSVAAKDGYAIPIDDAVSIATAIESGHRTATITIGTPAFLGVETRQTTTAVATGIAVEQVIPGTPAAAIGVRAGDRILSVGGTTVRTTAGLAAALRNHSPGDRVPVTWLTASGARRHADPALIAGPAN